MKGKKSTSKYYVDEAKFSSVNTAEVSYIMGLLWADGYLSRPTTTSRGCSVNILANRNDLNEVLPIFKTVGSWSVYERNTPNRQPRLQISYNSKSLWNIFKDYGYLNKSCSSAEPVLKNIPESLKHYWFRGYFDGDGGITVGKTSGTVSFTGSYEQDFSFVTSLLSSLDIQSSHRKYKRNSGAFSQITFSGKYSLKNFYNYIYSGQKLGFSRKRDKFELLPIIKGGYYLDKNQRQMDVKAGSVG